MLHKLDVWVSGKLPGWLIGLLVALFFALVTAAILGMLVSIVMWDTSYFFTTGTRMLFAVCWVTYTLIVWK